MRGLASVDLIVIDEAARVDDELLAATRPMLAVSNGTLFALTTPAGKRGWFYEQWLHGVGWQRIIDQIDRMPADLGGVPRPGTRAARPADLRAGIPVRIPRRGRRRLPD